MKTKYIYSIFLLFAITTVLIACTRTDSASNITSPDSTPIPHFTTTSLTVPATTTENQNTMHIVHLLNESFSPSSITLTKGSQMTLIDDVNIPHILANGYWINTSSHPENEPGIPSSINTQFSSKNDTKILGPFANTGTYHIYCTIHPGMNLTIIVQ